VLFRSPLPEQIRIANKLDSLLAKVETAQTRLEKIPALLKRFRQAVLAAATSGELTREWREEHGKELDFNEYVFGDLLFELRNGLSPKPNEEGKGFPILRISAVRSGQVLQDDIRYLECDTKTLKQFRLEAGDLLFTRYNGSLEFVGVCGLIRNLQYEHLLYPDKLIRAKVRKDVLAEYVEIYFSSPDARKSMTDCVKTTSGQKGISGKDIKSQPIRIPEMDEQAEIVRRVESLFAMADTVERQYQAAKARLDKLTQAILAKAFRGELVPQDPNDEPASVLLQRIQTERASPKPGSKAHAAN
jgi:type I restriction enzyme S subunit